MMVGLLCVAPVRSCNTVAGRLSLRVSKLLACAIFRLIKRASKPPAYNFFRPKKIHRPVPPPEPLRTSCRESHVLARKVVMVALIRVAVVVPRMLGYSRHAPSRHPRLCRCHQNTCWIFLCVLCRTGMLPQPNCPKPARSPPVLPAWEGREGRAATPRPPPSSPICQRGRARRLDQLLPPRLLLCRGW